MRSSYKGSRDPYANVPTRTDRPITKSSYLNIQDNSSNKNTAKYTDGTASDVALGTSGRGIAPFNAKNGSFPRKKGLIGPHKTDRDLKTKKTRGNGRDKKGILDDGDLLTSAPATHDPKEPRSAKKSASYLNMTSSFKYKVEGNFRLS